ncbi:hypothetical protein JCGZ_16706 [Jatropha curcas]|uniref:C2H2-type domain-containing protein n=1 Tax=Jatropha curcas TaxID=180498 RepID=A0A067LGV5_JATCU|nr:hypothetical protein JCGZ_16706 [Jatropha curcas]
MNVEKVDENGKTEGLKSNTCQECGVSFKKPAYLKQHMQSHSFERPYVCSVNDCHKSYRRKDHLTRHRLQHDGKLFKCPIETCNREFVFQGNVKRHVEELHIKLESVEAICAEPGCMQHFSNIQCLTAHIHSFHRYITCEICGTKQLKKNIKRHLRTHEATGVLKKRIKCHFKDCDRTFSNKTNLNQHVKAAHLEIRTFACGFPGCDMRFSYKHVRDRHEKSGCHVYTPGDFNETDEQFRLRPRGGMKRKCPNVETLIRKRVIPPRDLDDYRCWLHLGE